ncbi:archaetidylserine decarboxylase [bacterium]|nr:archaetidylserine decarboxylase [bacterium]
MNRYITGVLSKITGVFARLYLPYPINIVVLFLMARLFGINLKEAEKSLRHYSSFQALFTRKLKPDARPIASQSLLVSPSDGTIADVFDLSEQNQLTIKQQRYTPTVLCDIQEPLVEGVGVSFYLAPYNYHRFCMPFDAIINKVTHIPGPLYPVDTRFQSLMPSVFLKNERLVLTCVHEDVTSYVVLIGALNVGKISLPWLPECKTNIVAATKKVYPVQHSLKKGDELGYFEMGSSIVVLMPQIKTIDELNVKSGERIRMGEALLS